VGLKIPCTSENLVMAARLKNEGYLIGITAVFSTAQAYLAIQAGADYILPYVNRSTRLQGDGLALVHEIRSVIDASGTNMEIIAASIKTPAEAVDAHLAGAHHLTLPLSLIESMGNHQLSDLAIEEFNQSIRDTS
jgi:transaldolase